MDSGKKVIFVTGNKLKLEEAKAIIGDRIDLSSQHIDLPELQGEPEQIAAEKALLAYKTLKSAVIIEDTSLCFNAMNGLPGPYIKWFYEKLGDEGLYKMLEGFEDKTAYAQTICSYMAEGLEEPLLFIGRTNGKIVAPRGKPRFPWNPIFQPDGYEET